MNIPIYSILLGLGWKCLFNWALMFLQRSHICRSFLGVFSASLAVVDTILILIFADIHIHGDARLFLLDLELTRYHTCLLVQILGQVYSTLQWPIVVVAGLEHFCAISLQPAHSWAKRLARPLVAILLWYLTALYVFLLSGFTPVLEDVSHHQIQQCWVFHTTEPLQVVTVLSLILGCAVLHAACSTRLFDPPPQKDRIPDQSATHSRKNVVCQVLHVFLNTWALVLIFLVVLLLLPVGIPSYLGLNVAWLCFLNSFLIAVVLCVACPASQIEQGLAAVPPDSFCEWRFNFNLAAEEKT
ncbi:putative G-protein coupled receptor 160 [Echeneis naucrates]|nr:probable G-protein coupled receptor 160 [Echeneis naucrates]